MTTNIIELLHTTAAYQSAALQLMVGEANFAAKQLDLKESVPIPVTVRTTNDDWNVEPPPLGLGGTVNSSNYYFEFQNGKLSKIHKLDWFKKISPPITDMLELAERPSLLDTNSAYQLATQWLARLSVDVAELERKSPPQIFQVPARKKDKLRNNLLGTSNNISVPLFLIGWGMDESLKSHLSRPLPPSSLRNIVFIKILGTTKELVEFSIRKPSLLKRPQLQITNTSELLGPLPPPREFVEKLFGGKAAYEIVAAPEKVDIGLLKQPSYENPELKLRNGPVQLKAAHAKGFSEILSKFGGYQWGVMKACLPDYGVRLRFYGNDSVVEFLLCFDCDILQVTYNGKTQMENFDPAHNRLVKLVQEIFPNYSALKKLTQVEKPPNSFE